MRCVDTLPQHCALHTHVKSESLFGEIFQTVGMCSRNVLSDFRLYNCATCTINDKFTSFCVDTFSMCNKALILVGILPTEISQVIVGGNFLSYLNRKFWNKQKTQSRRSLWSVNLNYLSKSRKIEVEIFHMRLIEMEIFELLNPRFLFQVSEIRVCIWILAAIMGIEGMETRTWAYMRDRHIGYSKLFMMPYDVIES